jgi:hypothetical protein
MNLQVYLSFIVHQSKEWFYSYYYNAFGFNETGRYTLSVEVGGLNFFPIKPLFVDFFATTSKMSDGSFRSVLSTQ